MAINLLVPLLIPLEEQLHNVTQLLGEEVVKFEEKKYEIEIEENNRPGPVLQLRARTRLRGETIYYYLKESSNPANQKYFAVHKSSGILSAVQVLDFEQIRQFNLTVGARVGDESCEIPVEVEVLDQNEYEPYFTRDTYETQITEEDDRHLPKTILKVSASDDDGGTWGDITYSLTGEGAASWANNPSKVPLIKNNNVFSKNSSKTLLENKEMKTNSKLKSNQDNIFFAIDSKKGFVSLLRPLDRDPPRGRSQWRLKATATDGEWKVTSNVIINVKDVNDNAPFFPIMSMTATVPENAPSGTLVTRVKAIDNDDPKEAKNAKISYSLDKNVVDEVSGQPIFQVNNFTGVIKSHLCCLDREKTPHYTLQIVATDGGGLKGTGTVSIQVADANDVGPKFSRQHWILNVLEEQPLNQPIGSISVVDPDITNQFLYQIMSEKESSQFLIRGKKDGSGAEIFSKVNLDYENPVHRKGFKFPVRVTDMGPSGWKQTNHTAKSWVTLVILNINDNWPIFKVGNRDISLSEDTPLRSKVAAFSATDRDLGEESKINYSIDRESDPDQLFTINKDGEVFIANHLDREKNSEHLIRVLAVDSGSPTNTATATMKVEVSDVNDSPPRISSGDRFQVRENSGPQVIGKVYLDDPDDWTLGHGPPFTLKADPIENRNIRNKLAVSFDPKANDGRGVGEIRTLVPLDREENPVLIMQLIVADNGFPRQSATVNISIVVADVNDNPMRPASKNVIVHALQPMRMNIPLGRIFVKDPDDWDHLQKKYSWSRPHPLFILNTTSGELFMKPDARPGRYELGFHVSDPKHGQSRIESNVSVLVKALTNVNLKTTNPLVIHIEPLKLIHRTQGKPSFLELILGTIQQWLSDAVSSDSELNSSQTAKLDVVSIQKIAPQKGSKSSKTRLWLHTPHYSALQNFLVIQKAALLEELIGVPIVEIGWMGCMKELDCDGRGCWSKIDIQKSFSVIDANETSIVGPELQLVSGCGCQIPVQHKSFYNQTEFDLKNHTDFRENEETNLVYGSSVNAVIPKTDTLINSEQREYFSEEKEEHECIFNPCMNGGKCLPTSSGFRCICPEGSFGKYCKILSRDFDGGASLHPKPYDRSTDKGGGRGSNRYPGSSWVWLQPMPTCSNIHVSLEVKTLQSEALLLYTGLKISREDSYKKRAYNFLTSSNLVISKSQNISKDILSKSLKKSLRHSLVKLKRFRTRRNIISNRPNFVKSALNIFSNSSVPSQVVHYRVPKHQKRSFRDVSERWTFRGFSQRRRRSSRFQSERRTFKRRSRSSEKSHSRTMSEKSSSKEELEKISPKFLSENRNSRHISSPYETSDVLMLELHNAQPSLYLNLGDGLVHIHLNESKPINDNQWHRIDIMWFKEKVEMYVDLCSEAEEFLSDNLEKSNLKNENTSTSEAVDQRKVSKTNVPEHGKNELSRIASSETFSPFKTVKKKNSDNDEISRTCRGVAKLPGKARQLNMQSSPLQLGGVSRSLEKSLTYPSSLNPSLQGCVKNLRINRELMDLGHSLLSYGSTPECKSENCSKERCPELPNSLCDDANISNKCGCPIGKKGPKCNVSTLPSTFMSQSFATLALSFTPKSFRNTIQLRLRTSSTEGELIKLSSLHGRNSLSLQFRGGHLCLLLKTKHENLKQREVCLTEAESNDGNWHTVMAQRVGSSLLLSIDDSDGVNYNATFSVDEKSSLFNISRHEGCLIGGSPEYKNGVVKFIHNDFHAGCLDDLRLDGYPLPLPPWTNQTSGGQVMMAVNVESGCQSSKQCKRFVCRPPFVCFNTWDSYYCGCGEGHQLSFDGALCEDINECKWNPCLNGGTCKNTSPGFSCECRHNYRGPECQYLSGKRLSYPASVGMLFGLTSFFIVLLLIFFLVILLKRRHSTRKEDNKSASEDSKNDSYLGGDIMLPPGLPLEPPPGFDLDFVSTSKMSPPGPPRGSLHLKKGQHHFTTTSFLQFETDTPGDLASSGPCSHTVCSERKCVNRIPSLDETIQLDDFNTIHPEDFRATSSEFIVANIDPQNTRTSFPILKSLKH